MTRAPFDVASFGGFYTADRFIRGTVVAALEVAMTDGAAAAALWIRNDDRCVGGGWSDFAEAAFVALTVEVLKS